MEKQNKLERMIAQTFRSAIQSDLISADHCTRHMDADGAGQFNKSIRTKLDILRRMGVIAEISTIQQNGIEKINGMKIGKNTVVKDGILDEALFIRSVLSVIGEGDDNGT